MDDDAAENCEVNINSEHAPASEAALSSIDAYLDSIEASAPLTPAEEDELME